MKNKIKKFLDSKTPTIVVGILVFSFFFYKNIDSHCQLKKYPTYGVGKAITVSKSGISPYLKYIYIVDNKIYESAEKLNYECGKCKIGKYFRIKYSSKNPDYSELYFNQEVTDTIKIKEAGFLID
jgi:hypothetical protein